MAVPGYDCPLVLLSPSSVLASSLGPDTIYFCALCYIE